MGGIEDTREKAWEGATLQLGTVQLGSAQLPKIAPGVLGGCGNSQGSCSRTCSDVEYCCGSRIHRVKDSGGVRGVMSWRLGDKCILPWDFSPHEDHL